jgi:hypothetical protein
MAFRNWKQELEDQRPPRPSPWPFIWRLGAGLAFVGGLVCLALWVWPGYLLPKPWQRPGPPPTSLAIVFSSDLRGYLEPCGCTQQRWGGVARLMGSVKGMDDKARLLVDVGDMTAGAQHWQQVNLEHYLSALGQMKCAAANLGANEIAMSADAIRQVRSQSPVPLVSANVCDAATGQLLAEPCRHVMIENLRVTVVGVVVPIPNHALGPGVSVADVDESLGRLLPRLRPDADLIVLLAAAEEAQMKRLAQAHPEVDVILGGRVMQASKQVEMIGSCRMAAMADKGQMLGRMDVDITAEGQPAAATCRMIVLDNDVPEDASMLDLVRRYNEELARLDRTGGLAALGVPSFDPPAGTNRYVGSDACQSCHKSEYEIWKRSAHSRAYASLVRRQRDSNPDCVHCHVVDLGAGDAFLGVASTPKMVDVQCESCHGRAAEHVRAHTAKEACPKLPQVLPKSCQTCHDCIHSPQFSYDPYWEKIKHAKE